MKKLTLSILSFIFLLCAAIALVGCDNTGEQNSGSTHTFTEQKLEQQYLASEANCTEKATYYYSCICGEKGTQTFEYGNALGHSFTNYISDGNASCTQDGTKTATCDRNGCNKKDAIDDVGSAKGHTYSEKWMYSETEHWHAATCGHADEKGRAAHAFDANKKCTICDYVTTQPLGLELQSSVFDINLETKTAYMKVANAVTDYDFSDKFSIADGARFDVCTDKQCNNKIASKKTDLIVGDNVFYILVTNGNDVASYTITLRRRPIYTVQFDTNGGSTVKSQQVEEDALATAPTITRKGYFVKWNYDFSTPILKNETITSSWQIITYKITYVLNGGENHENNPTTYTIEDDITLSLPTKTGYTGSWNNSGKIEKGRMGDITFTAEWLADVELSSDGSTVVGLRNTSVKDLVILSEYIGTKVVSIASYAFYGCTGLTSVTIPDSVNFL